MINPEADTPKWELLNLKGDVHIQAADSPISDQPAGALALPMILEGRGTISALPTNMTANQMPQVASAWHAENFNPRDVLGRQLVVTHKNGVSTGSSELGTFISLDPRLAKVIQGFNLGMYKRGMVDYRFRKLTLNYPHRIQRKVDNAFLRAVDTILLPVLPKREESSIKGWGSVEYVVGQTKTPREIMERIAPLARILIGLNVQIESADIGLSAISERAQAMGASAASAVSEADVANRRELKQQREQLIEQVKDTRSTVQDIAAAEKMRIEYERFIESVIPEDLPDIPGLREYTDAIRRAFGALYDGSRENWYVKQAANAMNNTLRLMNGFQDIELTYSDFAELWGRKGVHLPSVEALQNDIAKHRDLR